jgi:hypothetical protein
MTAVLSLASHQSVATTDKASSTICSGFVAEFKCVFARLMSVLEGVALPQYPASVLL